MRWFLAFSFCRLAGCATTGADRRTRDPRDPLEGINRGVYKFNDTFDDWSAKPIATVYRDVLHVEIRSRVSNFFSNIQDIFIGVNNVLQGKLAGRLEDWARFAFNSTFGLLGIHDVASDMGLEKHNEDFGQTFGRWGVGSGPYLILPFLGSSTLRDTGGSGGRLLRRAAADTCGRSRCATRSTACTSSTRAPSCSTRAASSSRPRSTATSSSATPICSAAAA